MWVCTRVFWWRGGAERDRARERERESVCESVRDGNVTTGTTAGGDWKSIPSILLFVRKVLLRSLRLTTTTHTHTHPHTHTHTGLSAGVTALHLGIGLQPTQTQSLQPRDLTLL